MNRAVGARERLGGVTIPGALPGLCPRLISNGPLALNSSSRPNPSGTGAPATSLSPAFNHTPQGGSSNLQLATNRRQMKDSPHMNRIVERFARLGKAGKKGFIV